MCTVASNNPNRSASLVTCEVAARTFAGLGIKCTSALTIVLFVMVTIFDFVGVGFVGGLTS